jgi:hypothetical protein
MAEDDKAARQMLNYCRCLISVMKSDLKAMRGRHKPNNRSKQDRSLQALKAST